MAKTFNGTTQYLVITSALLSAYPISIACWYNPVNNTGAQALNSIGNSTISSHLLLYSASGILNAKCLNTGATSGSAVSVASLTTGSWNHCVGVFTSTASRFCYLNGVSSSNATSVTLSAFNRTSIGSDFLNSTTPSNFANGSIAHFGLWGIALSAIDVTSLNSGVSPLKVQPSHLVSYVRFIGASNEPDIVSPTTWTVTG
jgi:hypothetical protein